MTNIISTLYDSFHRWSFHYNCYETVHPYTPYCSHSSLEVGLIVFAEAIKLYTPLYLISQIMRRKFDADSFKDTSKSILRSTTFISANAFFALLLFCSSQYITGKFYYYVVAYLPAFIASCMAVMIEKPSRRSTLAFYVSNVASETLFRIYVGRGYLKPVPHGQVYLFTASIATIMYMAKKNGFESDPLSSMIKSIIGPEEAAQRFIRDSNSYSNNRKATFHVDCDDDDQQHHLLHHSVNAKLICEQDLNDDDDTDIVGRIWHNLKLLFITKHKLCPHDANTSCISYAARAATRALLVGYCGQLAIRLLTRLPAQIFASQQRLTVAQLAKLIARLATESGVLKFGVFLSLFSCVFKLANCVQRWRTNTDSPKNCFIAGLVAGPTFFLHPSPTMALYVMWKCLEIVFHETARNDQRLAKHKNSLVVILYGLATSQLFYSAVLDPGHIKKSYLAFLDRMSRHRLHWINRNLLDVFGTQASLGYEDFFPDLHPKFLSHQFLGSIWIWLIEHRFVSDQLSW